MEERRKSARARSRKFLFILLVVAIASIPITMINPFWLLRPGGTAYYTAGFSEYISNVHVNVPLDFVIVNGDTQKVRYSESDFQAMVEKANVVWQKANVTLVIGSFVYKGISDEQLKDLNSLDTEALKYFGRSMLEDGFEDNVIDVIFLKSFSQGVTDVAIADGKISAAFMTELDNFDHLSWTLAHELGHTMGLLDVFEFDNLMIRVDGTSPLRSWYRTTYLPTSITEQQVAIAHNTIEVKGLKVL